MYTYTHPRPAFTVDAVALCKHVDQWYILLIKRANEPFKGMWALPGGFLDQDERVEDAVKRELSEETGIIVHQVFLIGLYDKPDRDPRGRTLSAAFLTFLDSCEQDPIHGDDAAEARWFKLDEHPPLAFDHEEILAKVMFMLPDEKNKIT